MVDLHKGLALAMRRRQWDHGWRLGPRRWDWLRSVRCAIAGHRWDVNQRRSQRSCQRCWIVQDRLSTSPGVSNGE